jgi:1-acyl-sn-glycerol-3-phosphate acyltransferase
MAMTDDPAPEGRLVVYGRRLISIPGLFILTALNLALLPLLLVGGFFFDLLQGRQQVRARCHLAIAGNLVLHVFATLTLIGVWIIAPLGKKAARRRARLSHRVETFYEGLILRVALLLFNMDMEVEGKEALLPGPVILFVRHVSILDPILLAAVTGKVGLWVRQVAKVDLLWSPPIDLLGHWEHFAFVHRKARAPKHDRYVVEHILDGLGKGDGALIFPEGTRYSDEKKARIIEKLGLKHPEEAKYAKSLKHLLPPHPGGPLTLLSANEDADVIIAMHVGLEGASHLKDFFGGSLLGRKIRLRFERHPRSSIPGDDAGRLEWLRARWNEMDAWVADQTQGTH